MKHLKFGRGNAKLGRLIHTFTLPAGYTCPGARACLSRFDRKLNKMVDGKDNEFRCFAASGETRPAVRALADHNFKLLKNVAFDSNLLADLIDQSIPAEATMIRVHVGGDFFSNNYFQAWMRAASRHPDKRFYAYTKSLLFWVSNEIPDNFRLVASEGGKYDHLIKEYGLRTSKVVFSIDEAAALGLELDHDDSHAYGGNSDFALLIHGTQAKGTKAAAAKKALKGVGSYGKGGVK